jgi:2-polyprenyl-3-methyl-5-hydroxy-6-metoxy-1,4-benzoquinol methylase
MTACPLCGGALTASDRFGEPLLDCCAGCGSCFAREGRGEAVRSYGTDEYLARNGEQLDAEQRRHEARLRLRWIGPHVTSGTLLDVGAAAGFFVDEARAVGFSARGIEPSPALSAFARERLGVPVEPGLVEEAAVGERVDAACLWHVLEHADDPIAMLRAAAAHVRPGGHIFVEVPNIASPVAQRLGQRWPALAFREHLTHFSPEGLRHALEQAGLAPVELFTIARWRYRRPRTWASPRTLASAARDCVLAGAIFRRDPLRGDLLRAVARV